MPILQFNSLFSIQLSNPISLHASISLVHLEGKGQPQNMEPHGYHFIAHFDLLYKSSVLLEHPNSGILYSDSLQLKTFQYSPTISPVVIFEHHFTPLYCLISSNLLNSYLTSFMEPYTGTLSSSFLPWYSQLFVLISYFMAMKSRFPSLLQRVMAECVII